MTGGDTCATPRIINGAHNTVLTDGRVFTNLRAPVNLGSYGSRNGTARVRNL